uniref:Photosystem I assembly protein Ycf3 n=1 Tax=Olisthodiscus luteus TaxID=83000 RepID=A0A7U0KSU5_OLILU|nr:photosystem I assembly protein ycf3 [Olisthodiscus luteus]QQW50551.1 photosystem I assembly protein ycf3 [Olisthodiscus luteus]
MGRIQKNDNFIDKTFTILADIILKVFPASLKEKQAFFYYRDGMSAQSEGEYAEALENYYEALQIEEDPADRGFILYNIGLIYANMGEYNKALEYYHQSIDVNPSLSQAFNNIAVIYQYQGAMASERNNYEVSKFFFEKAAKYWRQAVSMSPQSYVEAQNWLKITGRE